MSMIYRPLSQETDPAKISEIIHEQLAIEKQIRIYSAPAKEEQHWQKQKEKFLSSNLVNKTRIYGCD